MTTGMPEMQPSVLIIDDDPLHLKIYTWILEREGYDCRTALVGETSVDLPQDASIQLVLLDYRLSSRLRATEVAQRAKEAYPDVPIVVLSEMPWMPDDMNQHAIAFINKGNAKRLIETVAAILDRQSASSPA
ncbi:MAG: response regulator [Acidobacteria bacterium]|nr:response regulator [Acidobacteriota bacterium]